MTSVRPDDVFATGNQRSSAHSLVFVCMATGDFYGKADVYIERLYGMLQRHVRSEFRLVCLTDRPREISSGIEQRDCSAWSECLREGMRPTTRKLGLFNPLYLPYDEFFYLDLTVIIKDDLSPLIDFGLRQNEDLVILKDWNYETWNSSVMRIRNKRLKCIYDGFVSGLVYEQKTKGDQDFIHAYALDHKLENQVAHFPKAQVASFKRLLRQGLDEFDSAKSSYDQAAIVKFHGKPVMHRAVRNHYFWLKYGLKFLLGGRWEMPVSVNELNRHWRVDTN